MKGLLLGIGIPVLMSAIGAVIALAKKRGGTINLGINIGVFISDLIKKLLHRIIMMTVALKKYAKKIEDWIELTLIDLLDGIEIGMRLDNKATRKLIKKELKNAGNEVTKIDSIKKRINL